MPEMLPLLVCALLSTVEAAAPAELGGTSEEPTPTAHSGGLDVSNFLVVLIAVGLISYCALRAVTPAAQSSSVMAGPPDPAHGIASFASFSANRVRVFDVNEAAPCSPCSARGGRDATLVDGRVCSCCFARTRADLLLHEGSVASRVLRVGVSVDVRIT